MTFISSLELAFLAIAHRASPLSAPRLLYSSNEVGRSPQRSADISKVLIVEDDFLIAMELEAALVDAGLDVIGVAASAEEAVSLAAAHLPTIVIMDIRLAGRRDGIDAALELFRDYGIRSVFASAHYDEDARRRAAPANPLGWIEKPYVVKSMVDFLVRLQKS